mmetsp:Transcript_1449/g.5621  ORF Transcript_1449/g.5621 Transcript_1449/m.5621 type:complete len:227 (-) Transcript_1449:504-1184(-)
MYGSALVGLTTAPRMGKKVRPVGTTVWNLKISSKDDAKASRSPRPRTDMTPCDDWTSLSLGLSSAIVRPSALSAISRNGSTTEQPTVDCGARMRKTSSRSSTSSAPTAPNRMYFSAKSSSDPAPQSIASRSRRTPLSESGRPAKVPVPAGACTQTRTRRPRSRTTVNAIDRASSSSVPTRYVSSSSSSSGGLTNSETRCVAGCRLEAGAELPPGSSTSQSACAVSS